MNLKLKLVLNFTKNIEYGIENFVHKSLGSLLFVVFMDNSCGLCISLKVAFYIHSIHFFVLIKEMLT